MDVREKLVELLKTSACPSTFICDPTCKYYGFEDCFPERFADYLIAHGVTVQEWINSEEMLPEFPCLAVDVNGNSVFIPDGILTIKDKHGEWCINASLAKEFRLINGAKIDALIWENRIAYWMPLPLPPKGE